MSKTTPLKGFRGPKKRTNKELEKDNRKLTQELYYAYGKVDFLVDQLKKCKSEEE